MSTLAQADLPAADHAGSAARNIAVIDIGSNSIRMVLFRLEGRALFPMFNEKTMAGLGRGAGETGLLNPEGVAAAIRTLKRFRTLLDAKQVTERHAVATAAVRATTDGPAFVERVREECGLEIRVLSGEEEGRLSAAGVVAGMGDCDGVTGDLGGSSLELTRISGRELGPAISLQVGPLAILKDTSDQEALRKAIDDALRNAEPVFQGSGPVFYAVGGAWRAFAHLAMAGEDHPLHVLHQFELSRDDVFKYADFAAAQSESSLSSTPGVSSKRAAMLPYAAQLLRRVMKLGKFERVVFSANGLREGVIYAAEPRLYLEGDPLFAAAEAMVSAVSPEPAFGVRLAEWIEPVFETEPEIFSRDRDRVIRAAAARLTDYGVRMHPDHRADLASNQVLFGPLSGISHRERAFLALAIHHRYQGKKPPGEESACRRLLDDEAEGAALRLGLALRLGAALSGRTVELLDHFRLERTPNELVLRVAKGMEDTAVERALHRLDQLAGVMDLKAAVL